MLNDTHVLEGLGDETVARKRGVHGAQQQLHRHIERELTGTGDGDRIVVDAQLDVVRGTVVAMADGVRERFAQGLDGIIPDGIVIHLAGRVHDGTCLSSIPVSASHAERRSFQVLLSSFLSPVHIVPKISSQKMRESSAFCSSTTVRFHIASSICA